MDPHNAAPMSTNALSPSSTSEESKLRLPSNTDPPGINNPARQKVWLIFGATGHMGRSVTRAALGHNDLVAAVGQTFTNSPESMLKMQSENKNCLGLLCDVRVRETVQEAIERTLQRWGRIDIVANCSGYGVIGSCEDQDDFDIRNQFETNFMGTLNMIQLSLAHFRARGSGRYIIFSSTSGSLGVPGLGPYCASKYAVEGLIESMLYEVDHFNIKGTLVEPGYIRRDDIDIATENTARSADQSHDSPIRNFGHFRIKPASEPYDGPTAPAAHAKRMIQWLGDKQPTSAARAAELVWQLGHCSFPPLRLLLGTYAVESVRDRLKCIIEEIEDWKHLNFPLQDQQPPMTKDNRSADNKSDGEDNDMAQDAS